INLSTGKESKLTPHEGPGSFFGGNFSPDGRTIYLTSNKDRDLLSFACVKLGTNDEPGPIEVLAAREDAELNNYAINELGTLAALSWNVAGRSELSFIDLKTNRVTPGGALAAEIVGGVEFSKDGQTPTMVPNGAAAPADIWTLDMRGRRFS